jgi:hypothetical protein
MYGCTAASQLVYFSFPEIAVRFLQGKDVLLDEVDPTSEEMIKSGSTGNTT